MTFKYQDSFVQANALEGYEHLILQAMVGDQTLFTWSDSIERLWEISEPLLENPPPVEPYAVGSWGPDRSTGWSSPATGTCRTTSGRAGRSAGGGRPSAGGTVGGRRRRCPVRVCRGGAARG